MVSIWLVARIRNGQVKKAQMMFGLGALALVIEAARAVAGLEKMQGVVRLGDLDLTKMSVGERARRVTYMPSMFWV